MAKTAKTKSAGPAKKAGGAKAKPKPGAKAKPKAKSETRTRAKAKTASGAKSKARAARQPTPAEALAGLLETPLVAEVIAAGAAAALSTLTQQALSKRAEGGTAESLKMAAKAAASAMGTRLASEFDEIVKSANESRRGSG